MKTTVYATLWDSPHALQKIIDDAVVQHWREQNRKEQPPVAGGALPSGATIYHTRKESRHD